MFKSIPKIALIIPACAALLLAVVTYVARPMYQGKVVSAGYGHSIVLPKNVKFDLGAKPPVKKAERISMLDRLGDLLVPPADATSFNNAGSATATVTPGANVNLVFASPQSSAAYVACNFAIAPTCRIYANAAISTLALYNGVDGAYYTVEIVQDATGRAVAVPTSGGTPAAITTQVAGWAVGQAPINAPVTAPTQQPGAIITWRMFYDSTAGSFIVYSIN